MGVDKGLILSRVCRFHFLFLRQAYNKERRGGRGVAQAEPYIWQPRPNLAPGSVGRTIHLAAQVKPCVWAARGPFT